MKKNFKLKEVITKDVEITLPIFLCHDINSAAGPLYKIIKEKMDIIFSDIIFEDTQVTALFGGDGNCKIEFCKKYIEESNLQLSNKLSDEDKLTLKSRLEDVVKFLNQAIAAL